jgi:hypothetical protein
MATDNPFNSQMDKTDDKILNKSKYELQMKRERCQYIYYILLGFFSWYLMIFLIKKKWGIIGSQQS